jgi:BASS family bile acid:Na+ symporter
MDREHTVWQAVAHFIHRHFLLLLLGTYVAAAFVPGPGLWLRAVSFGQTTVAGASVRWSLPLILLALLLGNAGLGVRTVQLRGLLHRPLALAAGLAANVLLPLLVLFALSLALHGWHSHHEAQSVLVGLAVVAAMPIAGSSAAWAQKTDGDVPLSLGLVLGSTLLSPWTTPLALRAVGLFTDGSYAGALHDLASAGGASFLLAAVVVPSFGGVLLHAILGETRLAPARPYLKLLGTAVLLALCYMNAAVSLPQMLSAPDWDFVLLVSLAVVIVCCSTFATGWGLSRLLGVDPPQRASLVYGLGMNNNGTGLVLAATVLSGSPHMLLPLIVYNLVQHLMAGSVELAMKAAPVRVQAEGAHG